jgi:hypothetical protein
MMFLIIFTKKNAKEDGENEGNIGEWIWGLD